MPTMDPVGSHQFINSNLIAVPSSGDENELYLVDISTGKVNTVQLDSPGTSTAAGRGRTIKYVAGTPYLWITAKGAEEVEDRFCYVVMLDMKNLSNSKVVRKVMGLDTASMLFVENMGLAHFHRVNGDTTAQIVDLQSEINKLRGDISSSPGSSSAMLSSSFNSSGKSGDSGANNALSIVAIVVGFLALVVSFAALLKKPEKVASPTSSNPPSITQKDAQSLKDDEELSMGSKREGYA